MGYILGIDDMYGEGLLETLNLRFGYFGDVPVPALPEREAAAVDPRMNDVGITELLFLQKEFELFKEGRPFWMSAAALGVGGQWNRSLKVKWLYVLSRLDQVPSEDPDRTGGEAIVAALIANFRKRKPDPVHFQAHDARDEERVLIRHGSRPLFYMERDFLTISMPFAPNRKAGASAPAKSTAATVRKTPRKR